MDIHQLTPGLALTPGADLWVMPDPQHSRWTSRVDWYTNALISKAENRVPQRLSEPLQALMEQEEIPVSEVRASDGTLLLATHRRLPNKWTLVIQFNSDQTDWADRLISNWRRLGQPRLRVFLPRGESAGALQVLLKKNQISATMVEEPASERRA